MKETEMWGTVPDKMLRAVMAGMRVVRERQLHPDNLQTKIKKGDETLVTKTDKQSEAAMMEWLRSLHCVSIHAEEGGKTGQGDMEILVDPLDGTRPFANGMINSVVIAAALDFKGRVFLCIIGEPATGRIWSAEEGKGCLLRHLLYSPPGGSCKLSAPMPVRVWQGNLNPQTTVFLDTSRGFTRKRDNKRLLTDDQLRQLFSNLVGTTHFMITGSNGSNLALVASGGYGVAGCICTCLGGPWDVAGALLVSEAGGVVRAFTLINGCELREEDPLKVKTYDILIAGNNAATAEKLTGMLHAALTSQKPAA